MERPQNKAEKATPKVILHFLRHSMKEKSPEKNDREVLLTHEGRELAAMKFEAPLDMRFAHVEGSPRIRTRETAAIAATQDSKVNVEDLGKGKVRVNEALDFNLVGEYGKRLEKEYGEGKLMTFLVHESDTVAKENGDTTSGTYSRMAANIAGIIYHNFEVASRGASILEQSEHPKNENNDFERILATHGAIQESFLLKLIEKMRGVAERDRFFALVGENGFGFTEGFDVTLFKENGEEKIRITYKKENYAFDEIIPVDVIKEIIAEGA